MLEYKYFHPGYRVKLSKDKYTKTTIIAVFQKCYFRIFWRTVKEVNFDVFDYSALGNEYLGSEQWKHATDGASDEYITISYNQNTVRELWHPKDFDLDKSLERHSSKIIYKYQNSAAK